MKYLISIIAAFFFSSAQAANIPFDLEFIDTMTEHHQMTVDMSMLALERSKNPEVQNIAKKLIEVQEPEIELMQRIRTENYNMRELAINNRMMGMAQSIRTTNYEKLKNARNFDRLYIQMLISHQQGEMTMTKTKLRFIKNNELKELARTMMMRQRLEIVKLKSLFPKV